MTIGIAKLRHGLLTASCLLALAMPSAALADDAALPAAKSAPALGDVTPLAIGLKDNPRVYSDIVKLGDLFTNTGAAADTVIGRSPEPGQTLVLNAAALKRIASSNGINWKPESMEVNSELTRASQHVTTDNLADTISKAIAEQSGVENWAVLFDNHTVELQIPVDSQNSPAVATLSVDRLDFSPENGRFYAEISALSAPGKDPVHLDLYGQATEEVRVPIVSRTVPQKGVITANDIDWKLFPKGRLLSDTVMSDKELVGQEAIYGITAGQPVRHTQVQAEHVIQRGDLVTMIYQTPFMRVTAQGRALDEGALGQTIRIMNTQSSRTIEATISGPDEVQIATADMK